MTASRLVAVDAPAVISQAAAPGAAPVSVTARANPSAPPLVSRLTGRTLIPARAGSLAGHEVTWHVRKNSVLREVGTIVSSMDQPMSVGADGTAQFVVQPGVDPTRGSGHVVEDWETVEARFQRRGLVAAAYAVPQPLAPMSFGASRARANVRARDRATVSHCGLGG